MLLQDSGHPSFQPILEFDFFPDAIFSQMTAKNEHRVLLPSLLRVSANKCKSPDALTARTNLSVPIKGMGIEKNIATSML